MYEELSEEVINSFRKSSKRKRDQDSQTEECLMDAVEILERDLDKTRMENMRLQKALKQTQDNLSLYAVNNNNTSSKFMLPSEFKAKWESMVKELLSTAFITLFEQPILVVYVVQGCCLYIEKEVKGLLNSKTDEIAKIMGIDLTNRIQLQSALLKLFQDNYTTILRLDLEKLNEGLKQNLKLLISQCSSKYRDFIDIEEMQRIYEDWFDSDFQGEDMQEWIKTFWLLSSYIVLSDSELSIGLTSIELVFMQYKKNDYYCIDGFGKDGAESLIILPPVKRQQQHVYNGIKHALLILPQQFKDLEKNLKQERDSFEGGIIKQDSYIEYNDGKLELQHLDQLKSYNSPKQMTQTTFREETRESPKSIKLKDITNLNREELKETRIKPQLILQRPRKSMIEEMRSTLQALNQQKQSILKPDITQRQPQNKTFSEQFKKQIFQIVDNKINENARRLVESVKQQKRYSTIMSYSNLVIQSFCSSQRTGTQQQSRLRTQSNESSKTSIMRNIIQNVSSDDEEESHTSLMIKQALSRSTQMNQRKKNTIPESFIQRYKQFKLQI